MRTDLNLEQEDVSLHNVRIVSDGMSTLQRIQSLLPSQQVTNSDKNEILDALTSLADSGRHLNLTRCPSHFAIRGKQLTDEADNEGTTVEQGGVCYHGIAKAEIGQATKEPIITH